MCIYIHIYTNTHTQTHTHAHKHMHRAEATSLTVTNLFRVCVIKRIYAGAGERGAWEWVLGRDSLEFTVTNCGTYRLRYFIGIVYE